VAVSEVIDSRLRVRTRSCFQASEAIGELMLTCGVCQKPDHEARQERGNERETRERDRREREESKGEKYMNRSPS
jgi:hypothetical protein